MEPSCSNGNVVAYLSAAETISNARSANLSICDYVERLWNQAGQTERIIANLDKLGCFKGCQTVCEIGPGTGRYLERVMSICRPQNYEIYETAPDWREWLRAEHRVKAPTPDGCSLHSTITQSCDLVMAHGVFPNIPAFTSFSYMQEADRVLRSGGYFVFDCLTEDELSDLAHWIASKKTTLPVPIPRSLIGKAMTNFSVISEFTVKYDVGKSRYFVFTKL